tara:strand:+ start:5161 stop:5505 length:345 start_codon:yes stop_codon:yes gene_type:complete
MRKIIPALVGLVGLAYSSPVDAVIMWGGSEERPMKACYEIKQGDTLEGISDYLTGSPERHEDLKNWNNIDDVRKLVIGDFIYVPKQENIPGLPNLWEGDTLHFPIEKCDLYPIN